MNLFTRKKKHSPHKTPTASSYNGPSTPSYSSYKPTYEPPPLPPTPVYGIRVLQRTGYSCDDPNYNGLCESLEKLNHTVYCNSRRFR